jgi:hypothetical protein
MDDSAALAARKLLVADRSAQMAKEPSRRVRRLRENEIKIGAMDLSFSLRSAAPPSEPFGLLVPASIEIHVNTQNYR